MGKADVSGFWCCYGSCHKHFGEQQYIIIVLTAWWCNGDGSGDGDPGDVVMGDK